MVRLDRKLYLQLQAAAKRDRRTVTDTLAIAVETWLGPPPPAASAPIAPTTQQLSSQPLVSPATTLRPTFSLAKAPAMVEPFFKRVTDRGQ